jgi:hypothetical protein
MMDKDTRDIVILRRLLETTGRWILFVHQGHIVKVARVAPEMSADAVLGDSAARPVSQFIKGQLALYRSEW